MSDAIAVNSTTGEASFAFLGSRSAIWHRKGQAMPEGTTVAEMAKAAGWDFKIKSSYVRFATERGMDPSSMATFNDYVVLFHSKTLHPLGVVSDTFKIAQPEAAEDCVDRLVQVLDGKIDTMGVLHDGAGLFANIIVGESIRIIGKDTIQPNALFNTRNDGTAVSRVKFCTERAVCANTVAVALGEGKHVGDMIVSHRSVFDPAKIAATMALAVQDWQQQAEAFRQMAQHAVSRATAEDLIFALFNDRRSDAVKADPKRDIRNSAGYSTILGLFAGAGRGATLPGVKGTAWGLFNGVSEYFQHHATAKSESHRFDSNLNGTAAEMKDAAFRSIMKLVTAEA